MTNDLKSIFFPLLDKVKENQISNFSEYEKLMNEMTLSIACDILKKTGQFKKNGESFTLQSLLKAINCSGQSAYLIKQLLFILVEENFIRNESGTYTVLKITADILNPVELFIRLTKSFPEEATSIQWIARAYNGMLPLIKNEAYPEDILFPDGDMALIDELYSTSKIYSYYSKTGAMSVDAYINSLKADNIKFLEIGAGTGNGTDNLLKLNNSNFSEYMFTDIARSFIKKAGIKYRDYPFMTYKLLDITRDPAEQNMENDCFDIIYAVNVLHALKNVSVSLKYLHGLLKKGGALIITEISPPSGSIYRYMELTFGLIPSYFSYEDSDIRPRSPLLCQSEWIKLFNETGFSETVSIPDSYLNEEAGKEYRGGVIAGIK